MCIMLPPTSSQLIACPCRFVRVVFLRFQTKIRFEQGNVSNLYLPPKYLNKSCPVGSHGSTQWYTVKTLKMFVIGTSSRHDIGLPLGCGGMMVNRRVPQRCKQVNSHFWRNLDEFGPSKFWNMIFWSWWHHHVKCPAMELRLLFLYQPQIASCKTRRTHSWTTFDVPRAWVWWYV